MLILGRRTGESLVVGDHVTVRVLSVRGNHVQLGITAPNDVRILRAELRDRPARGGNDQPLEDRSLDLNES